MSRLEPLSKKVEEMEHEIAKHKAVLEKFPDAKLHYYMGYFSKEVNNQYTAFSFEKQYSGLFVVPYCEVEFTHQNKTEYVKVSSVPRASRLVHLFRDRKNGYKPVIKFSRFTINLKNNQFKEDMLNSCRAEIMNYIKDHPGVPIDKKHLEPRLQKLLLFT